MQSQSFVDVLTGVANRRRFDEVLEAEWRRCRRLITPLALLMNELVSIVEAQLNEARRQGRNQVCGQELAGYFSNTLK
ncbi:MAG: diguanylate cyclase [Pseudomonadota bacterium]